MSSWKRLLGGFMSEISYGKNAVLALSKAEIEKVYTNGNDTKLLNHFKSLGVSVTITNNRELDHMTKSGKHQGVVAFVKEFVYDSLQKLILTKKPIVLLDEITDPHNVGAIIRTIACAGGAGVVIPESNSCLITPSVRKVASGGLKDVMVVKTPNLKDAINELKQNGYLIVGSALLNALDYKTLDYPNKTALIMGSEDKGISPTILKKCDQIVKIPVKGTVDSLNVSVATGILLYEIIK